MCFAGICYETSAFIVGLLSPRLLWRMHVLFCECGVDKVNISFPRVGVEAGAGGISDALNYFERT